MLQTIIETLVILFILMSIVWTLLPWAFGLQNYVKSHNKFLGLIARCYWLALLAGQPLLLYAIGRYDASYGYLLLLLMGHILFLRLFGDDLGTG